jgi:hypothetical protein
MLREAKIMEEMTNRNSLKGTLMEALGIEIVELGPEKVVMES